MLGFDLGHDEYVLAKSDEVSFGGPNPNARDRLVLTNTRLVLVTFGLLRGVKRVDVYPLKDVKVVAAGPQAVADGTNLEVYLRDRMVVFAMPTKKAARTWAYQAVAAMSGCVDELREGQRPAGADTGAAVRPSIRCTPPRKRVASICTSCGTSVLEMERRGSLRFLRDRQTLVIGRHAFAGDPRIRSRGFTNTETPHGPGRSWRGPRSSRGSADSLSSSVTSSKTETCSRASSPSSSSRRSTTTLPASPPRSVC